MPKKLFRKTGLFPYKDSAENSKRWWENQGYSVVTKYFKGKAKIAGRIYTGYYQNYVYTK